MADFDKICDDQDFVLKWNHHESTLLAGLSRLLETDTFTDITLSVGYGNLKAHRVVLATCSTYFLELFQDMPAVQHPILILKDMEYEDLQCLISFMYKGQCRVAAKRLNQLITMAKILRIRGLCDMQVPSVASAVMTTTTTNPFPIDLTSRAPPINEPSPLTARVSDVTLDKDFNSISVTNAYMNMNVNYRRTVMEKLFQSHHQPAPPPAPLQPSSCPTECQICGKQLSNQYNLRVHLETHENSQHACSLCPHISRSRDALRKHVSYRHPDVANDGWRKRAKTSCQAVKVNDGVTSVANSNLVHSNVIRVDNNDSNNNSKDIKPFNC